MRIDDMTEDEWDFETAEDIVGYIDRCDYAGRYDGGYWSVYDGECRSVVGSSLYTSLNIIPQHVIDRAPMIAEYCRQSGVDHEVLMNLRSIPVNATAEEIRDYFYYIIESVSNRRAEETRESQRIAAAAAKEEDKKNRIRKMSNTASRRSSFVLPMGFEYTFHARNVRRVVSKIKKHFVFSNDGTDAHNVYADGNLVELCSPVHKYWKGASDWYGLACALAKMYGMRPWSRNKGGGGMHINLSIDHTKSQDFYRNLFAIMILHPEINWVFNEPSDNHTANWMYGDADIREFVRGNEQISDRLGGKGYGINVKDEHHFEVRTFEMPRSRKEYELMVKFMNSLMSFAMEITSWGVKIDVDSEMSEAIASKDIAINRKPIGRGSSDPENCDVYLKHKWNNAGSSINELLRALGLDPREYKRFLERNLYVRKNVYGESTHMT